MKRNAVRALVAQFVLLNGLSLAWAQQGADTSPNPAAADNTKVNQQDRSRTEPTADRQKWSDLRLTAALAPLPCLAKAFVAFGQLFQLSL
jgi:hypothetical protein